MLKFDIDTWSRRFVALGSEEERIYVLEMERCVEVMEAELNTARFRQFKTVCSCAMPYSPGGDTLWDTDASGGVCGL